MTPIKGLQVSGLVLLVALVATVALVGCGGGGAAAPGQITGSVLEVQQQRGVSGATVTIDGDTYTTDASGEFTVAALTPGSHTITVSAPGFETVGPFPVTIASGTTTLPPIYITRSGEAPPDPPTL